MNSNSSPEHNVGSPPSALGALVQACRTLVSEFNDFWVLSATTDNSFEEGVRAPALKRSVASFERAGVPAYLLDQVRIGINGNLASILLRQSPHLGPVRRNPGEGQDIVAGLPGFERLAVEVKLVYECTYPKYYAAVAHDWAKLEAACWSGCPAALSLAVFFVELPAFEYPEGFWPGNPHPTKPRTEYIINDGILSQFDRVNRALGLPPTWPGDGPFLAALHPPKDPLIRLALATRYASFHPSRPWRFDPEDHLRGARVGCAVWEYSTGDPIRPDL